MSNSFDPNELMLLQRIVELAAADLGIDDDERRSLIASRVVAAAERGEWDFDLLMAHAKGKISHAA
jgi:hypothetical protein